MQFPRLTMIEQQFPRPQAPAVEAEIQAQFNRLDFLSQSVKGKKIAVAVGSRGIARLADTAKATIAFLRSQGAEPFIIPAMGSHGGGTPEGQANILADYGITEKTLGVPIHAAMETLNLGETEDGIPVTIARTAYESDGVILINRIKPHTDFHGEIESGLLKMITIGLGKQKGAMACHSHTSRFSYDRIITDVARRIMATGKILGGIALLENAYHEIAEIEVIPAEQIETREKQLLPKAKALMPSLPVEKADVLLVERIGKNISGVGLDPNITGRWFDLNHRWQETPNFTRIVVLDLTEESKGNAAGIGLADFCTRRTVEAMDRRITYLNAITSRNVISAMIPLYFDTERETLEQTLVSLGERTPPENARLIWIRDTLNLDRILVSEALLDEAKKYSQVSEISEWREMSFDKDGNLRRSW